MTFDSAPLADRSALNRTVRSFFDRRGFLEADGPCLCSAPIPESHIELFAADRLDADGRRSRTYLVPSPEVHLKRLLAAGAPSLYQIGRCFRNGEQTDRWHRSEFTMLEWYLVGADAPSNIPVMEALLDAAGDAVRPGRDADVRGPLRRMTMDEAFRDFAGFSLASDLPEGDHAGFDSPELRRVLAGRLAERGLPVGDGGPEAEDADDLFHRLFVTLVEDRLPTDRPLVLTEWPALVPTLARRIPGTPWADRWELYIRGVEVANCYGEETERSALEAYWAREAPRKAKAAVPVDSDEGWIDEVASGLPRCSGAAVGLDRLLALIRGDTGLEGLDLFPINDMIRP